MARAYRCLGALVLATGCSDPNPGFYIDLDLGTLTGSSEPSGTTSTGEPTTGPTTGDATPDATTDEAADGPGPTGATSEPDTTTDDTASADPTLSTSAPLTGTGGPSCGDGEIGPDEQCDAGADNGAGDPCKDDCTLTTCGDGYQGGEEQCDLGGGNHDEGACTLACALPVCGDGFTNGDDNCDSGPQNGTGPGLCSADCKSQISGQVKQIVVSAMTFSGKLFAEGMTGIVAGDKLCGAGFDVMAAAPDVRAASTGPFDGQGQQDWVLDPYTAYVNKQNIVVFVTGASGLLGVVDGQPADLLAPIGAGKVWTGLQPTWQTADATCNGWNSSAGSGIVGDAAQVSGQFISMGAQACDVKARLYCVQQ